ncbi:hypothetical protein FB107DRAFT_256093 [Schizophyllum commune]
MRCAHPCAHSVLHALHTLALSHSSVSHPSRYPSPSSHLGFVVSCADSSGYRIRFALSNSWIRIHGMGTMTVGSYTDASVRSLCFAYLQLDLIPANVCLWTNL